MITLNQYGVLVFTSVVTFFISPASAQPSHSSRHTADMHNVPFGVTALSTLGRASFAKRQRSAYGGEIHLDQMFRLGTTTRFSSVFGGSAAQMNSFEGRSWLMSGNSAIRLELNQVRNHAIEFGASYDYQLPTKYRNTDSKVELYKASYFGPYIAYEWDFSHTFFVIGDVGVSLQTGHVSSHPHVWCALGIGTNVFLF